MNHELWDTGRGLHFLTRLIAKPWCSSLYFCKSLSKLFIMPLKVLLLLGCPVILYQAWQNYIFFQRGVWALFYLSFRNFPLEVFVLSELLSKQVGIGSWITQHYFLLQKRV